jgi:hypothetical protein
VPYVLPNSTLSHRPNPRFAGGPVLGVHLNPPEGSTIYYDNFRLGPIERDDVLFMPQCPERLDAMILTTPWGWCNFSETAREGVLRRVEKDGTGVVFIMPFPGGEKPVWTDDLRKICALVDAPSDVQPERRAGDAGRQRRRSRREPERPPVEGRGRQGDGLAD